MSAPTPPAQTVVAFPLAGILTIVFVVLKLTNVIAWSWVWVLSPLWISFLFTLALLLLFFLIFLVASKYDKKHPTIPRH